MLKYAEEKYEGGYAEIIGRGSFGRVLRVVYNGHEMAVKKFYDPGYFYAELKITQFLHTLSLPNVITFYPEHTALGGIPMAYMRGGSLSLLLPEGSAWDSLDNFERYRLAACICNGVRMLHRHGVLHGDIKPANILLDENLTPCLSDFGGSVLANADEPVKHTSGSTGYTAPEVFQRGHYSTKSDVYSLGTTLWQLFFRKTPFDEYCSGYQWRSRYPDRVTAATAKGRRPGDVTDEFGELFRRMIQSCWLTDPAFRPSAESCYQQLSVLILFSIDPSLESDDFIPTAEDEAALDEAALRRRLIHNASAWIESATNPLRLIDRMEYLFSREISDPADTVKKSGNIFFRCTWRGETVSPALSAMAETAKKKVLSLYAENPAQFSPDEKVIIRNFLSIPRSKGLFGGTLFKTPARCAKQFDVLSVENNDPDCACLP